LTFDISSRLVSVLWVDRRIRYSFSDFWRFILLKLTLKPKIHCDSTYCTAKARDSRLDVPGRISPPVHKLAVAVQAELRPMSQHGGMWNPRGAAVQGWAGSVALPPAIDRLGQFRRTPVSRLCRSSLPAVRDHSLVGVGIRTVLPLTSRPSRHSHSATA